MSTPVKKVPIHLQSAQNRLLIKNGKIVNADGVSDADVYVEDGIIKQVGRNLIIPGGTRVIEARGRYVIPGGIDPHTHFQVEISGETSPDDFYQGTKAAIAGGTTMIIDFAIPKKGESLIETYGNYRTLADEKVCCDYALHMAVTWWSDKVKQEMEELCKDHGINSFKVFMAYKDVWMLSDSEIYEVFEKCKQLGAIGMVHAENGDLIEKNAKKIKEAGITGPEGHALSRPEELEAEATNRACAIANQVSCPLYVVHVMGKQPADMVAAARARGCVVIGETLAAALGSDSSHYRHVCWKHAASRLMAPPLRDPGTQEQLVAALVADSLQLVGSDNATFTSNQKLNGFNDFTKIPVGVNGVEDRMSVVWEKAVHSGQMEPTRFVEVTSTNAAKIFNLYPRKGCIAVGSDADLVVWDPNRTRIISSKTHHHAIDYNIFEGLECHGVAEYVVVNGRVVVDECELKAVQGFGKFVSTPVNPSYLYDRVIEHEEKNKPRGVTRSKDPRAGFDELQATLPVNGRSSRTATLPNDLPLAPSSPGDQLDSCASSVKSHRNLQASTFSISGEPEETVPLHENKTAELDEPAPRVCIRVKNPPGGKSSGGFW